MARRRGVLPACCFLWSRGAKAAWRGAPAARFGRLLMGLRAALVVNGESVRVGLLVERTALPVVSVEERERALLFPVTHQVAG